MCVQVCVCMCMCGHGHACVLGSRQWAFRSPASPTCLEQMGWFEEQVSESFLSHCLYGFISIPQIQVPKNAKSNPWPSPGALSNLLSTGSRQGGALGRTVRTWSAFPSRWGKALWLRLRSAWGRRWACWFFCCLFRTQDGSIFPLLQPPGVSWTFLGPASGGGRQKKLVTVRSPLPGKSAQPTGMHL